MRNKAVFLAFFLLSSLSAGCLGEPEEEKSRFSWPENQDVGCGLSSEAQLNCTKYLDGFQTPVQVIDSPDGKAIWIVDLSGHIKSWDGAELKEVANFSADVSNCHNEQGLLGMEFTDDFYTTGTVLLSFVKTGPCSSDYAASLILAEATVEGGSIENTSLRVLHEIEQPYRNHNGGSIQSVGENQYLWGIGDGGGSKDPFGHGQNKSNVYGTILLFEYSNQSIQPVLFDAEGNETYILHYGLRNPWKFDLDPTGGLWIADVGQYCYEEVSYIPNWNSSANFGWSITEGLHEFDDDDEVCEDEPHDLYQESNSSITLPVMEYDHSGGNCSVTGGQFVDWGMSAVNGTYVFGDFCSGMIWSLEETNGEFKQNLVADTDIFLVGFGKGLNDELLMLSWSGQIYALTAED